MHAELMLLWPLVVQPFLRAPTWVQKLSTLLYSDELTPLSPPYPTSAEVLSLPSTSKAGAIHKGVSSPLSGHSPSV